MSAIFPNIFLLLFSLKLREDAIPSDRLKETEDRRQELVGNNSLGVLVSFPFSGCSYQLCQIGNLLLCVDRKRSGRCSVVEWS